MTLPGGRLRAIAARMCRQETMERVIDPLVADLQWEWEEAVRQGRLWTSRRVRISGYVVFLKVIALAACEESMRTLRARIAADLRRARHPIGWAVSALVILTALLELPALLNLPSALITQVSEVDRARLLIFLIPQALPIAVPIAFTIAILCGTSRTPSPKSSAAVLAIGLAGSLSMLAILAWLVPASNQAFRVTVAGRDLLRGIHELTLDDLGRQVASALPPLMDGPSIRQLATEYHGRWALACATFFFAWFGLAVASRRPAGRAILGLAAFGIYFAGYITVFDGTEPPRAGDLPVAAIAWLPNIGLALASVALTTVRPKVDTARE